MDRELPGWAIPVLVVVGLAIVGGIWMMAGNNKMSKEEMDMAQKQSEVQQQLGNSYKQGGAPGQTGEAEARRAAEAQQSGGY